jgi:hypothetical protein
MMNTSTVIEYSSYGREKFENLEKYFLGKNKYKTQIIQHQFVETKRQLELLWVLVKRALSV